MENKKTEAFGRLLEVMDRLRVECPWDREQTFQSLRNSTIEETYELIDAIADGDMNAIRGELGDMLLHVVFYSKMADEQGDFDIADVANGECEKLIFRHPHVFGDADAQNAEEVKKLWEQVKLKEKERENKKKRVLSGVPRSLPALVKAYRISQKAASAGFDWKKKEDVWDKVHEESAEVNAAIAAADHDNMEEEFGDLFFALTNAARLYGIDPEAALERCNRKFIARFTHIEECAELQGKQLKDLTPDDMEALWCDAKQKSIQ